MLRSRERMPRSWEQRAGKPAPEWSAAAIAAGSPVLFEGIEIDPGRGVLAGSCGFPVLPHYLFPPRVIEGAG